MPAALRVLTYNVLAMQHADGRRRQAILRERLPRLEADVVALQEVTRSADFDQVVDLFGPDAHVVDQPEPSEDGVGACLVSRWPLGRVHMLDQTEVPGATGLPWAATVAVEIDVPWGPVLVVHHKPNWQLTAESVRERQAVRAARFIDEVAAGRPVVVLGDFDAGPDAASMRFWTGRQSLDGLSVRYDDAWEWIHPDEPGLTFDPRDPLVHAGEMGLERGRRIDHILVRSGVHGPALEVVDCRLVFDEPVDGIWVSDHFGVLADLRPPVRSVGSWDAPDLHRMA